MAQHKKRLGVLFTLGVALLPLLGAWGGGTKTADKNQYFVGKVVPLADLLAKQNIKLDADASPVMVLQTDAGKLYPLIKDEGSRRFFKDAKLLNHPLRLTARLVPNSPFLQVINVHSLVKGKLHDVYYWCDICTIKRFEAGVCDCCGAPLDFREEPYNE